MAGNRALKTLERQTATRSHQVKVPFDTRSSERRIKTSAEAAIALKRARCRRGNVTIQNHAGARESTVGD